jgi:peptidoglycan/LPS O-acetylase OafA/YrhL
MQVAGASLAENDTEWIWSGRVPCLDGCRAVAISGVIAGHILYTGLGTWTMAHSGVTAFFVVSGFLITLLLLREKRKFGGISLADFFKRRALRILPASIVFLLVVFAMQKLGVFGVTPGTWIRTLTYTACYGFTLNSEVLAHMWSLSVEEHFYLLWPLLLVMLRERTAIVVLCSYVAATPFLRAFLYQLDYPYLSPSFCAPAQMSSIAVGCLLAFFVTGRFAPRAYESFRTQPRKWALAAGALGVSAYTLRHWPTLKAAVDDPTKSIAIGLGMLLVIQAGQENPLYRFLNSKPMVWIGSLSYSLYLWQEPITMTKWPTVFRLMALAAVAALSYFVIERPFLAIKKRSARLQVPGAETAMELRAVASSSKR